MADRHPLVLLDDARETGAADALLYEAPREIFVARRAQEVAGTLEAADAARRAGGELAGYIAYEAGLALEERLAPRADRRTGGAGPLVWLGLFDAPQRIPAAEVETWLAERAPSGAASDRSTRSFRRAAMPPPSRRCRRRSARATSTRPI